MFVLYADLNPSEREAMLRNQANKVEQRNYSRTISESELEAERIRFVDDHLELQKLQKQMENAVKDYKARIKNIEERNDERLEVINTKKKSASGHLFGIANQVEGRMMYYDKFGELIESRDLLPDEKQGKLFAIAPVASPDLPLETVGVVETILSEQGNDQGETVDVVHVDAMSDEYLSGLPHDESGWEDMDDAQLMKKYGTTKMAIIRTMTFKAGEDGGEPGKWVVEPKQSKGDAAKEATAKKGTKKK